MDLVAVGAELAANVHLGRPESTFAVNTGGSCFTANLLSSDVPSVLGMSVEGVSFLSNVHVLLDGYEIHWISIMISISIISFIRAYAFSFFHMFHFHHMMHVMEMMSWMMMMILMADDSSSLPILISWGFLFRSKTGCFLVNYIHSCSAADGHVAVCDGCFHVATLCFPVGGAISGHEGLFAMSPGSEFLHCSSGGGRAGYLSPYIIASHAACRMHRIMHARVNDTGYVAVFSDGCHVVEFV